MANKDVKIIVSAVDNTTKQFKDIQKSVSSFKLSIDEMQGTFQNMRNYGGIAFAGISFGIIEVVEKAGDLEASLIGLQSIVEGTGNNFDKSKKFLDSFTADGLVPMQNAATALKNLLAKGFSLDEATVLMDRFKDSASFGRQAALSLGEAVQSATEGIKNENSILVDNAGVTKNISVMQEEYAKSLGLTVAQLTDAQKNEAIYQGVIKETQFQVGDAEKASNGYQGTLAKLNASKLQLAQTIGEVFMPILTQLYGTIQPIIKSLGDWISKHPELTKNIGLLIIAITGIITVGGILGTLIPIITTGFTGLIAVVKGLGVALTFLATNPIGIIITVIGTLILIGIELYKNWDSIKGKASELGNYILELYNKYSTLFTIFTPLKNIGIELYKNWDSLKNKAIEFATNIPTYWQSFKDSTVNIFTSIKDVIMQTIQEGIDYVLQKIEGVIDFVNQAVDTISSAFNKVKTIGGNIKDSISSAVSSVGETISGKRATGGPVTGGSTYLVGEKGPELFTPSRSGNIIPNDQLSSSGGNTININMGGVVVTKEADENRLVDKIKKALINEARLYNIGIT